MGENLSFRIRDDHLNLGGKPSPETILFVPLCICIWFFVQSEWVLSSWSGDDESQTTGRSAEDKECSVDEAAKDFGGGNSEVAFSAMKMSSEIWWWKKTLNFSVFFWLLLENMCIFLIFFKHVEKPKNFHLSSFWAWMRLLEKLATLPQKRESQRLGEFWVWFSVGEAAHHFYPIIFGWHFLGMGWWNIPSHFVCVNPSWKIWVYLPVSARWVCGGSVEVVLGHSWRKALMVCLIGNTFHSPRMSWSERWHGQIWELFGGVVL